MANRSDEPAPELTSRLRHAAQRLHAEPADSRGPAPRRAWTAPAGPTSPPAYSRPLGPPSHGNQRSVRTGVIIAVGVAIAMVIAFVVVPQLLSGNASEKVGDVPESLDGEMAPSPIFGRIAGYSYAAVPQSHLDAARRAVESRTDAGNIESVNGRVVRKDKTTVAEAIAITFVPGAAIDAQGGIDAVAAEMSSSERVTISGSPGLYGQAPDGSQVIVVYKDTVGIVVAGFNRATMQDVTAKLLARI